MVYKFRVPAKINIGLSVLSKRKDGYHNIETIFYPMKIYDAIKLKISPATRTKIKVTTDIPGLNNKKNICYRAADLFLREFGISGKYNIEISIKKNIPVGAGLGGGSSDAAGVLRGLYRYFRSSPSPFPAKILLARSAGGRGQASKGEMKFAVKLGSDVPYFLSCKTAAYGESKGEKLRPLPAFRIKYPILIVYPGIRISTKWAYKKLKVTSSKFKVLKKIRIFNERNLDLFENDFEEVVFKKYPEIGKIKKKMHESGAVFSLMSGSGSAVYGIFKTKKEIRRCRKLFVPPASGGRHENVSPKTKVLG